MTCPETGDNVLL